MSAFFPVSKKMDAKNIPFSIKSEVKKINNVTFSTNVNNECRAKFFLNKIQNFLKHYSLTKIKNLFWIIFMFQFLQRNI